jgi:hypothetical protein
LLMVSTRECVRHEQQWPGWSIVPKPIRAISNGGIWRWGASRRPPISIPSKQHGLAVVCIRVWSAGAMAAGDPPKELKNVPELPHASGFVRGSVRSGHLTMETATISFMPLPELSDSFGHE